MKVRTALLELFKADPEYRRFFKACCETSAFRLRSQAWQFWDELAERGGAKVPRGGRPAGTYPVVEDALMGLARELLPGSPAAQWDSEWAVELCRDALARLGEHFAGLSEADKEALDLFCQDPHDEAMVAAGHNNDPAAFRSALQGWEKAGREAIENLRKPEFGRL